MVTVRNVDAWRALGAASDRCLAAFEAWNEERTSPHTAREMEAAAGDYAECLAPLIGHEAAFAYEAATRALLEAIERHAQLNLTMSLAKSIDAIDAEMLLQCAADQRAAEKARKTAEAAVLAALEKAKARNGP